MHVPEDRDSPDPPMQGEEREVVHRRVKITREMVRRVGFMVGCPGCRAVNRGLPAVNHKEECRRRFEDSMRLAGDDRIARADQRMGRNVSSEQQG